MQPWCCVLFEIEELIQANQDYGIFEAFPNNIAIGTNGGGELLLLQIGTLPNKIEAVPALFDGDGTDELLFIANSFSEFVYMLGEKGEEDDDEG